MVATGLRMNQTYIRVYINTLYFIVMYAFPFFVLAVLNSLIGIEIKRARANRTEMSNSCTPGQGVYAQEGVYIDEGGNYTLQQCEQWPRCQVWVGPAHSTESLN